MKQLLLAVLTSVLIIGSVDSVSAQEPIDMEQTVNYLRSKLPSTVTVDFKPNKGLLIVTTMKNGEKYMTEELFMNDVDYQNISYNEDEGQVMVRCKKGTKCCDREIHTRKMRDQYGRMKFEVPANSRDGFIKAMKHLAMLFQVPNYQNSEPFE